jgi:glycosyltransferase involved in cell wall biosynthesis
MQAVESGGRAAPGTSAGGQVSDASEPGLTVMFVVFQTDNRANGGVESITQVIERLPGVRRIVVTQFDSPATGRWRDAGAEVHILPTAKGGRAGRVWSVLAANRRIAQLIRRSGVQVVHCNDIRALWHAVFGGRAAGASVVFNVRDVKSAEERYGWTWRIAQLSDRILVLSQEMRDELRVRLPGTAPGRSGTTPVGYIYSIVDPVVMYPLPPEERNALRLKLGIPDDELCIGYIATVTEKKAQLRLLEEAGPALKSRLPTARIHFVGDFQPERSLYARRCLEAVGRLGLESHVSFPGFSPRVTEWYQACDIVLLASRREGLARCMIEGLACGCPVISFDVCSAREILEEHGGGRVVRHGDYTGLVDALTELGRDPVLRHRIGEDGCRTARRLFAPEATAAAYAQLYQELASQRRNRA